MTDKQYLEWRKDASVVYRKEFESDSGDKGEHILFSKDGNNILEWNDSGEVHLFFENVKIVQKIEVFDEYSRPIASFKD